MKLCVVRIVFAKKIQKQLKKYINHVDELFYGFQI